MMNSRPPVAAIGRPPFADTGGSATLLKLSRALRYAGANVVHTAQHGAWVLKLGTRFRLGGVANCDSSALVLQPRQRDMVSEDGRVLRPPSVTANRKTIRRRVAGVIDFAEGHVAKPLPWPRKSGERSQWTQSSKRLPGLSRSLLGTR